MKRKRTVLAACMLFSCVALFFAPYVSASEMTGGDFAIEISTVTSGGGRSTYASGSTSNSLWGALAQPVAIGRVDGPGTEHLYSGVFTPYLPEPCAFVLCVALLAAVLRRRGCAE